MEEKWLSIKGYENYYEVSSTGKIRSLDRVITFKSGYRKFYKGQILKHSLNNDGYCIVALCKNGNQKSVHIHRIVAEAFIEMIDGKPEVNHIDENKENNNIENLEWVDRKENCNHGTRNERIQKVKNSREYENTQCKPIRKLDLNGNVLNEYKSITEAARELNGHVIVISRVINGQRKTAYGYKWELI